MSNNKQSSVEWFSKESWNLKVKLENKEITIGEYGVTYVDLLNQAKAMHKEEVVNFAFNFYYDFSNLVGVPFNLVSENKMHTEFYYDKTFGGNNDKKQNS